MSLRTEGRSCLGHQGKGYTEITIIDPNSPSNKHPIIATGFFDNEDDFAQACLEYNGTYNIYAGRNPRPAWLFGYKRSKNKLETKAHRRAKDEDIEWLTAISLDIDPRNRQKGQSATDKEVQVCVDFAERIRADYGGMTDMTGNGSYFWAVIPPIPVPRLPDRKADEGEMKLLKEAGKDWQEMIAQKYNADAAGVRIDGCFDLSLSLNYLSKSSFSRNSAPYSPRGIPKTNIFCQGYCIAGIVVLSLWDAQTEDT